MKNDTLRKFVQYRKALIDEKARIESRLREINGALAEHTSESPAVAAKGLRVNRFKNPLSLRQAILKVTSEKPLKKGEILAAIEKLGYQFSAKNPMNSLNVVLYGKNPKFKNDDGKFSPVKSGLAAAKTSAK